MTLSYDEAVAQITAPGQIFEVVPATVDGIDYKVFSLAPPTLKDLFSMARGYGDRPFLVFEDERWSFAEVMERVDALGALLVHTYGVGPGDRVGIAMRNFPEWVVSFAAVTSIGAVSVSLNAWWVEEEMAYALDDCTPTVLIADAERARRAGEAVARNGIRLLVVRSDGGALPAGADRWEEVLPLGEALPDVAVAPDDDATILYTSGTTGRPKGAVSTHRAVTQALFSFAARVTVQSVREAADAGEAAPAAPSTEDRSFILIVPLFHVTGCVPVMLACFGLGMKLVMMYRWDPERALELIERERVTSFVGVPTQAWDMLESPRFGDFDTSSLQSVGGGGAPAPPTLAGRVASSFAGGAPTIGYGMTETNAYGPGNTGQDFVTHPTSTGRTLPTLEVAIRDPDGRDVGKGERGEIWLKGPNLIRGYWNRPEATAESIVEGWLRTGDLGHVDDEGFLYIDDRLKDMILRGGENVYSAEVEGALYDHPDVYEAAVFGVPDERLGEIVAATVVARPGATVTEADLRAHVASQLAAFKVPDRIDVVDAPLPRNPAGKILKRELRETFVR